MKKTLVLFASFLFLVCLSGCVTVNSYYKLSDIREIHSVEIYDPEKRYYEGNIHDFLDENEPILTIPAEDCADFLNAIEKLEFTQEVLLIPIPMDGGYDYSGYILVVFYSDGSYDLIADGGMYLFRLSPEGERSAKFDYSDYCGEEKWSDFVERYMNDFITESP